MTPFSPHRALSALVGLLLIASVAGCGDASTGDTPGVETVFGQTGMGPGEFSYPRAAVIGANQRLYVVDKSARIQGFSLDGRHVIEWRMPEFDAGKPTGLGVGPDGRVYAADTHYARVVVFEADGRPAGQFGTRGSGPGQFIMPTDVVVDPDGFIYVSEYGGNDRVSKFAPDRRFVMSFGRPGAGPGEFERPQSLLLGNDGTLWIADACNHRICHFTREVEFLGAFGQSGTGPGELRFPYGVDWLSDGTLVVAEYGNNRLQRFDTTGRPLGIWGRAGRRPGQLAYPWAVAVGPQDHLFVIDSGNNRVQVLDPHVAGFWRLP